MGVMWQRLLGSDAYLREKSIAPSNLSFPGHPEDGSISVNKVTMRTTYPIRCGHP